MKEKIYILDDFEATREKIKQSLIEEYNIVGETNDGAVGFDEICKLEPDLVVLDLVVKTYDGFELLEKIQNCNLAKKPKLLVLSSLKGEDFAQKAIDLGASYYMIKPIESEVLSKRVKKILSEEEKALPNVVAKNSRTRLLDEKISNVFITVGIPAHIKGYQFLREAIKMAIAEPDIINSITKQLYPSIAERFATSASKVERAIRHAIEVAWNRGKIENINSLFGIKVYSTNEKPTNGEFIALVADKMLIEGA